MVCGNPNGERRIVIARDAAACADGAPSRLKSSRPGSVVPANSWKPGTGYLNEAVLEKGTAQAF
jgi:hypothetical protein